MENALVFIQTSEWTREMWELNSHSLDRREKWELHSIEKLWYWDLKMGNAISKFVSWLTPLSANWKLIDSEVLKHHTNYQMLLWQLGYLCHLKKNWINFYFRRSVNLTNIATQHIFAFSTWNILNGVVPLCHWAVFQTNFSFDLCQVTVLIAHRLL